MTRRAFEWARRRPFAMLLVLLLVPISLGAWTQPPARPSYEETRSGWRSSEAWLRDRDGRLLDTIRIDHEVRRLDWVPLDHVPPAVAKAVVISEDKRVDSHGGVDWRSFGGSIWATLHGRHARGASTITMQLAGLLAPDLGGAGNRSFRDKLRQVRAARAIEARWSKDQILEAYLNLASVRGETQGIGAAARSRFGKAPDALGGDDALLMAALLPSPQAPADQVGRRACRLAGATDCSGFLAKAQFMVNESATPEAAK